MDLFTRASEAEQYLRGKGARGVEMAVILGTGLGGFEETMFEAEVIPYKDIPFFPKTKLEGHLGCAFLGMVGAVPTLALQGRVHYYEGYPMDEVTFPIRVLKLLRIPTLILTCAGGGLDIRFRTARLMLIQDHINLMGVNPLRGDHDERFGTRFPDLSKAYDPEILRALESAAVKARVTVRKGVYAALPGPSYETPSEIKMLKGMGVDALGMSTIPEVIVANQMGMKVGAICSITNLAAGLSPEKVSHEAVQQEAAKSVKDLNTLLSIAIPGVALTQR